MSGTETLAALAIAGMAMYGLGLPVAWFLPAPTEAPWLHRIAIAPLYAIVLATVGAWSLSVVGFTLHPLQLVTLGVVLWVGAWRFTGHRWALRDSLHSAVWPALMVAAASATWFLSLVGYGLYLPNRDFKNHAYFVAQVAWTQSADPSQILTASPGGAPETALYYPLGLHTLLGWALPTPMWNSVGVTAAAAVLACAVSLPLAFVVLARMWDPQNQSLWMLAGLAGVSFPGLTGGFEIGSVVLIAGTALYAAALACLWLWLIRRTYASAVALGLSSLGLFFLHVAEAVGLVLVALGCLPLLWGSIRMRASWRSAATVVAVACVVVVSLGSLQRLGSRTSADWDISPNAVTPLFAWMGPFVSQPGGPSVLGFCWTCFVLCGVWLGRLGRMHVFPLIALGVPVGLSFLAEASGVPDWLGLATAPWYGTSARVSLLAAAPIALLGCYAVSRMLEASRKVVVVLGVAGVVLIPALSWVNVESRRTDLHSALAGAGDTQAVARRLAASIQPGATVLNFEDDGTANLFAFARVPVLDAFALDEAAGAAGSRRSIYPVQSALLKLDEPSVARRMEELGVGFVAVGTTTRYWGQGPGYDWQMLAAQPELTVALSGTDMIILRYEGRP